jgi:hypothetical protein
MDGGATFVVSGEGRRRRIGSICTRVLDPEIIVWGALTCFGEGGNVYDVVLDNAVSIARPLPSIYQMFDPESENLSARAEAEISHSEELVWPNRWMQ